jgi:hypothetical protein
MAKKKQGFKLNRASIVMLIGFALEVGAGCLNLPNSYIRNALIIAGIAIIFISMIMVRKDNPFSEKKEAAIAEDIGFDFGGQFTEYLNVLSRKAGSLKYSTWRNNILKTYNRFGTESDSKKKNITQDIRYYLKESRRTAEEKVENVKVVMIPAEFGIIASIYELDLAPITDEMAFAIVMVFTALLIFLCSVEIKSGNKIIKFIDDFCEVLEIPIQ